MAVWWSVLIEAADAAAVVTFSRAYFMHEHYLQCHCQCFAGGYYLQQRSLKSVPGASLLRHMLQIAFTKVELHICDNLSISRRLYSDCAGS